MKDWLYFKIKSLKLWLRLNTGRLKRSLRARELKGADFFQVPIIINNRNRYTWLRALISWLESKGYKNICILDNQSSYPPLLGYYKTLSHPVIFLERNAGYKALWESRAFRQFEKSWYVYTDPDLLPTEECPGDVVERLYRVLNAHPQFEKAGVGLRIDDLPAHYANRNEVLEMEGAYWKKEIAPGVYDAPVDTTFALYRPYAAGIAEECPACRTGSPYTFRHMPWYENSASPSEEESYYRQTAAKNSAYWTNK